MQWQAGQGAEGAAGVRQRLARRISEHLGVSSMRLWRVSADGDELVHASGHGPFAASLPIRHKGRTVGRLDVGRADRHSADDFDRIALWLVLVLDAVALDVDDSVARAAASWRLSPMQTRVLQQMVLGRDPARIALALGLPEEGVRIHLGRILRVTGAASATEVVARLATAQSAAFVRSPCARNGDEAPGTAPLASPNRED